MDNNMKYIKLFENFENKKPISDEDWEEFDKVNKKYRLRKKWLRRHLIDNGDGTFDYNKDVTFIEFKTITSLKEMIPLPIKNINGDFICARCTGLTDLKGSPQYVKGMFNCYKCTGLETLKGAPLSVGKDFYCVDCTGLTSLKYAPQFVGKNFIGDGCTGLTSLKYAPVIVKGDFWCVNCIGLISDLNVSNKPIRWGGYLKEGIQVHLNSEQFSAPVWFESLVYVGVRDPEAYVQVCKDFPNETTFTEEQVEEYLNSPLIDRKSTEADWKVVKDILNRTKKYDHSEYRDSKLDSEWKEIF